jgi:hypothetical protein
MIRYTFRRSVMLCVTVVFLGALLFPGLAQAGPEKHYCESRNNVLIVRKGQAKCVTDGTSFAKASGRGSMAEAYDGGEATAVGDRSYARAGGVGAWGSKATARGAGSTAIGDGSGEASANGDGSYASSHAGYASATGTNSRAQAVDPGSASKANGRDSHAVAVSGGEAGANGISSFAQAGGYGSRASADGDYSSATAAGNCYVYAGAGDTQSCSAP